MSTKINDYSKAPLDNYKMALAALISILSISEYRKLAANFCEKYELDPDFLYVLVNMGFLNNMLIEGDWSFKMTKSLYGVSAENAQAWMMNHIKKNTALSPEQQVVENYSQAITGLHGILLIYEFKALDTDAFIKKYSLDQDFFTVLVDRGFLTKADKGKPNRFKRTKKLATLVPEEILARLRPADEQRSQGVEGLKKAVSELNALPSLTNPVETVLEEVKSKPVNGANRLRSLVADMEVPTANPPNTAEVSTPKPDVFDAADSLVSAYRDKVLTESTICDGNCGMNHCNEQGCIDNKQGLPLIEPTNVSNSGMPALTAPYSDFNTQPQSSIVCLDCIDKPHCASRGCFKLRYPSKVTTAPTTGPFIGPGQLILEPPRTIDSSKEPTNDYFVYVPAQDKFYTELTFEAAKKVAEDVAKEDQVPCLILRSMYTVECLHSFQYTSLT